MLAAFLDCVEAWSKSVEEQLRAICAPTPKWNQATAALQLLCIGAAIGGKIKPDASVADMIDGAFSTWPAECARPRRAKCAYCTTSSLEAVTRSPARREHRYPV